MKNPVRAKSHNYLLTTRTVSRYRVPPSSEELHQILREGTKDFEGWHEAMCDLKKKRLCATYGGQVPHEASLCLEGQRQRTGSPRSWRAR